MNDEEHSANDSLTANDLSDSLLLSEEPHHHQDDQEVQHDPHQHHHHHHAHHGHEAHHHHAHHHIVQQQQQHGVGDHDDGGVGDQQEQEEGGGVEEVDESQHDPTKMMNTMGYLSPQFYPTQHMTLRHPQVAPYHMMFVPHQAASGGPQGARAAPGMYMPAGVQFAGRPMMPKSHIQYPYSMSHHNIIMANTFGSPYAIPSQMPFQAPTPEHHASGSVSPTDSSSKTPKKRNRTKATTINSGSSSSGKVKKKNRQRAVRHNWTQEQDDMLIKAINSKQYSENGEKIRWTKISQEVFQNKLTPQSVYQRYMRVLNPKLNTKEWTTGDDEKLTILFNEIGDQWALIAKKMNGMKADVWIRQRAVRLGLISDGSSSKQAGSSPSDKKSRKRKSPTGRGKRPEKNVFNAVADIQKRIASDEELRMAASQFIVNESIPTKKPRKSTEPRKNAHETLDEKGFIPTSDEVLIDLGTRPANLFIHRRRSKCPKMYYSLDDVFVSRQTDCKKYLTVKISHSSILQCFQGENDERLRIDVSTGLHFGLKNNNICVSSYRTHIVSDSQSEERELVVQFPVNLISMYTTLQDKTQSAKSELSERKIFICVSLKKALGVIEDDECKMEDDSKAAIDISSVVNKFEKFEYGENYNAYHLFNGGSIEGQFLSSPHCLEPMSQLHPIALNISFSDVLFQEERDVHGFSNTDFKFLENVKDMRYLVLLVNKLNQYSEGAQFMNLQWDMNCPFCNDFSIPEESDHQHDADLFEGLKQHLNQDHGDQFRCEFWNKSEQVDHYYIVATQLIGAQPLPNANLRQSFVPVEGEDTEESDVKRRRIICLDNEVAQAENLAYSNLNITSTTQYLNTVLIVDLEHVRTAPHIVESWNSYILNALKDGYLKSYMELYSLVHAFLSQSKEAVLQKNNYDVIHEHLTMLQEHNMLDEAQANDLRAIIQKPVYQDYNEYGAMHNVQQMSPHHQLMAHGHMAHHPIHLQHFSHLHMQHPQHLQQIQMQQMQHSFPDHVHANYLSQDAYAHQQSQVGQSQADQSQAEYANHMMHIYSNQHEEHQQEGEEDEEGNEQE